MSTFQKTDLDGVLFLEGNQKFADGRGFFREDFHRRSLEEALGEKWQHLQENLGFNKKNVFRGFHIAPWSKLIHVPFGEVTAIIFDPRPDSPTFKKHQKFLLSHESGNRLYLPPGLGNAYFVVSDEAVYEYQVSMYFKDCFDNGIVERAILYSDPELAIEWPSLDMITSEKDQKNPTLAEYIAQGFDQEIQKNTGFKSS